MVMEAVVSTVDNKYRQLVDSLCQIKNGTDIDYDKLFSLVQSIHEDEMMLIYSLHEEQQKKRKPELKIPKFMFNKRA